MSVAPTRRRSLLLVVLFTLLAALSLTTVASAATIVVEPLNSTTAVPVNVCPGLAWDNWSNGWFACDENSADASGGVAAVAGPATPPLGTGSARFTIADNTDGPALFNPFELGLPLSQLTQISYDMYWDSTSVSNDLSNFFINIDYDLTDAVTTWQGRLVWVAGWTGCTTLVGDTWQSYDPFNNATGCWLQSGTPFVGGVAQAAVWPLAGVTAATWAQVLAQYPNAGIHASLGGIGLKMGSGQPATVTAVDAVTVAYDKGPGEVETTWNFEPQTPCTTTCYADAVNGNNANGGATPAQAKKTIQAAVNQVTAGGNVIAAPGEYIENVTIPKSLTLTGAGQTDDANGTVIDGSTLNGRGITINAGITDVTIEELRVEDFKNASGSGIYALGQNDNFTVQNTTVDNNGVVGGAAGGIYMNGPVDNVLIDHVTATNNNTRGIVIWNGFKTDITITNNTVTNNNCCGIELQDGTASGVTVTGNIVSNNTDSGMAFVGLKAGAGPNVISGNTLDSNGRFGIEIKLPDGTGLDTGDGSIVVENNNVSLTTLPTDLRDYAGIAAFRRGWVNGNGNVDIPTGVVIRNNTVSGYQQTNGGSNSTGFGIVVEGTNMTVTGNTLNNNDVGAQTQGGHLPYTANTNIDGDQSNLADDFFGRGNSPVGCNDVTSNTFSGNGTDWRVAGVGTGIVTNIDTGEVFCTIQTAIDDTDTVDGHTLEVEPGTYPEQVVIDKSIILVGVDGKTNTFIQAPATIPAASNPDSTVVKVTGAGVSAEITGFTIKGPGPTGCGSIGAGIFVRDDAHANIHDNAIVDIKDTGLSGCQNGIGIRVGNSSIPTAGTADIVDNMISTYQKGGIVISGTGSQADIEGNMVTGDGPISYIAENGIQVSGGAMAEIKDNTVSGHSYTPANWASAGILLYGPGTTNTEGNIVSENQVGIWIIDASGNHTGNTVSATFTGTQSPYMYGFIVDDPPPGRNPAPAGDTSSGAATLLGGNLDQASTNVPVNPLQVNVITGNTITSDNSPGSVGIETDAGYGSADIDLTVTKNIIHNWEYGVIVYECTSSCQPSVFQNVDINRNSIVGNTDYGVLAETQTNVTDATCNWWGDASGPSGEGPGTGDAISTLADYEYWLLSNDLDGYCGPPPTSFCPVDPAVGLYMTDVIGTGMGSLTRAARNRKLNVPNWQNVESMYGQLASAEIGQMKWVRFAVQGQPTVQVNPPTSAAYRPYAINWWGAELEGGRWVKGAFFWGKKGNRAPRAFVVWPTYRTNDEYANVLATFDDSYTNWAYEGDIPTQTQTVSIPATQAEGATLTVKVAVVGVNKDPRQMVLTVAIPGDSQMKVLTKPTMKDQLNLETFTFTNVPAGVDEITITLHSPSVSGQYPHGGDSAAMIGAAANYACALPDVR